MPRSSAEILATARAEIGRGRPRAALRELEAARAELLGTGDVAGLAEALEMARGISTLAPVDTTSRERLLEALEQNIATLSPAAIAKPIAAEEPVAPADTGARFVPYGGVPVEQILAPAHAEIERGKTGRALRAFEKARRKLLDRGDVNGLHELIELAERIPATASRHEKGRRQLIDAARQNVRYLSRRSALKAGDQWSDPFAAAEPTTRAKLPSLPPMTRREIAIAVAIVVAIVGVLAGWALANRAPQRVAHAIKCPTGEEGSPTWSPDGGEIAFAKNGSCGTQITIISAKGGPTRELTERYSVLPDWSPDGQTILYRSHDGFSIIAVKGGESRFIRKDDGAMGAVWSPDGAEIAYTHGLTPDSDDYSSTAYVMKSDGRNPRRIIGHSCNPGTPEWSANGKKLAFACWDGVRVSDLSRSKTSLLVDEPFRSEFDEYPYYPVPPKVSWSPDGRSIAFGWNGVEVASSEKVASSPGLWEGRTVAEVYTSVYTSDGAIDVAWSPDGKRIAYSVTGNGSDDGLYVIDRDGSHRKRLVRF